ncbi:MAG: hypothetical protein ACRDV9_11015 [Acidimicrobiia bacterium]
MSLAGELASSVALLPWRRRNALIESLFYDLSSLSPVERAKLTSMLEREGSIVVVSPGASGRPIRRYKKALRFINKEGDNVQAIALAGVGSSARGTAAWSGRRSSSGPPPSCPRWWPPRPRKERRRATRRRSQPGSSSRGITR